MWRYSSNLSRKRRTQRGVGGVTPNFKQRGWSKDFLGFEIFDSGIFFWKFGECYFGQLALSRDFWGYSIQNNWRFVVVTAYSSHVVLLIKYNQACFAVVVSQNQIYNSCKVSQGVSNKTSIHSIDFSSIVFHPALSSLEFPFVVDISSLEIFKARKFGMRLWSRDIFWVALEALGIFWGFDFCPRSIIPRHLKSGVPPPPPMGWRNTVGIKVAQIVAVITTDLNQANTKIKENRRFLEKAQRREQQISGLQINIYIVKVWKTWKNRKNNRKRACTSTNRKQPRRNPYKLFETLAQALGSKHSDSCTCVSQCLHGLLCLRYICVLLWWHGHWKPEILAGPF